MSRNGKWRMESPCADCPFSDSVKGTALRESLAPRRMAAIKRDLSRGAHFTCHKTTDETGDGSNLMCAGAMAWQNERGLSSNLQRVCERLDYALSGRSSETGE